MATRLVVFGKDLRRYRHGKLEICELPTRTLWKGGTVNPLSERFPLLLGMTQRVHAHQYRSVVTNLALFLKGRLGGAPVFVTDHGGASYNYADRFGLERFVQAFLPVSQFSADSLPKLAEKATAPIFGGVDTSQFYADERHRRRQVTFVGRLLPHKGVDVLIEAVDDRTPLLIVGRSYDAAYHAELHRLAQGKDVTFVENASDTDVAEAYRRSRAVVLPSVYRSRDGGFHPWPELLGLTLLEAMACGTPVIGSAVGGIPEIIAHGHNGFIVEPGNAEELGERVHQLLEPSEGWTQLSRNARLDVEERYTWARVAQRCLELYE